MAFAVRGHRRNWKTCMDANRESVKAQEFEVLTGRTVGGLAARQEPAYTPSVLAAPATGSGKNTYRDALIPLACWRLEDIRFGFDDSFLAPESAAEFRLLHELRSDHPKAPLSVFGHADPAGKDDYN